MAHADEKSTKIYIKGRITALKEKHFISVEIAINLNNIYSIMVLGIQTKSFCLRLV